jgi:hypothetical protein
MSGGLAPRGWRWRVDPLQARGRTILVGGYVVTFIGSIAYLAMLAHLGYFPSGQSLAFLGEFALPVLANAGALVGWWWLSRLTVTEPSQQTLVRRAL